MNSPYQCKRGELLSWLADDMLQWDHYWAMAILDGVAECEVLGMFRIPQVYEPVVAVTAALGGKWRHFCVYLSQTQQRVMSYEMDECPEWKDWKGNPKGHRNVINGDRPEIYGELKRASVSGGGCEHEREDAAGA